MPAAHEVCEMVGIFPAEMGILLCVCPSGTCTPLSHTPSPGFPAMLVVALQRYLGM